MVSKYGRLMLPGAFPDNAAPDIVFTGEAVVQCDVPVIKTVLYVLVIYKWSQINFDLNTYELFLHPISFIVLVS